MSWASSDPAESAALQEDGSTAFVGKHRNSSSSRALDANNGRFLGAGHGKESTGSERHFIARFH